jgi:hypothetical protein
LIPTLLSLKTSLSLLIHYQFLILKLINFKDFL